MLDECVPGLSLTLDKMVEVCASVNHRQGPDGLSNGNEDETRYGVEEGNTLLEAGEQVELDQGF